MDKVEAARTIIGLCEHLGVAGEPFDAEEVLWSAWSNRVKHEEQAFPCPGNPQTVDKALQVIRALTEEEVEQLGALLRREWAEAEDRESAEEVD